MIALPAFITYLIGGVWQREQIGGAKGCSTGSKAPKVLEVGVGTGANLASYPGDLEITAIDFSPNMLRYARRRASELGLSVEL